MEFEEQIEAVRADQGDSAEEVALLEQEVVGAERLGEGIGANARWPLELGASHEGAFFKPVNGINATLASLFGHTRQSVLLAELSAYRLARALGAPFAGLVPPCVLRHVPEVDADAPGSLTGERFDPATPTCSRVARSLR